MVGKSKGNKQVNKNAAKDKSTDSSKHKKMAKARNDLGGGQSKRVRSRSKKERITYGRGHLASPLPFFLPSSQN